MLTGAGLPRLRPHRRAHAFFSQAFWDPDQLGLRVARAVVEALLPANAPVLIVVDDTLLQRVGKKVFGVLWAHDGSGRGKDKLGFGNTWVIAALVVRLPFLAKPVALPVDARLWRGKAIREPYMVEDRNLVTGQNPHSATVLADRLLEVLK
jgi:hypothetical protein